MMATVTNIEYKFYPIESKTEFTNDQISYLTCENTKKLLRVPVEFDEFVFVGFPNDDRVYMLPINIISKFDKSVIYGYYMANGVNYNEKLELDKFTYETFKSVYDTLLDPAKLIFVPEKSKCIMDSYGLINEVVYHFNNLWIKKLNEKLVQLTEFVDTPNSLLLTKKKSYYADCKAKFTDNPHIVPVQILYDKTINLLWINIYNGLPIYSNTSKSRIRIGSEKNLIDMNHVREIMLCSTYNTEIDSSEHWRADSIFLNDTFYSNDEIKFLEKIQYLHNKIMSNAARNNISKKNLHITYDELHHIHTPNMIDLSKYTSDVPIFYDKIIAIISNKIYGMCDKYDVIANDAYRFMGFVHL